MDKTDSRYPYTYSADYVRMLTSTLMLSRGDASLIVGRIAEIIGMDDKELKSKIADRYIEENSRD
jgi:hypothetical protein